MIDSDRFDVQIDECDGVVVVGKVGVEVLL